MTQIFLKNGKNERTTELTASRFDLSAELIYWIYWILSGYLFHLTRRVGRLFKSYQDPIYMAMCYN